MFDTLFGEGYALKIVLGLIFVLALIALAAWLVRRFGSEHLGTGPARSRQPRLAVIDAASVDGRRRLVLIRRDNVEHLMMIGGPTDVVVEANIVRGAAPAREPQVPRAPAAADTLPRAVPLGEGSTWPLQPEPIPAPAPAPRVEPPAPRAAPRQAAAPPPPPPEPPASITAEEEAEWAAQQPEPEPAPPPPPPPQPVLQRRARPVQEPQLPDLAEELARAQPQREPQPQPEPAPEPRMPPRREPRIPRPQTAAPSPPPAPPQAPLHAPAAEAPFSSPADQNLAEMAQRLEAALRRPATRTDSPAEPAPRAAPVYEPAPRAAPARAAPAYEPPAAEPEEYTPPPPPPPQRAPEARPARSDARPARADRAPAGLKSSVYDSLEQEMASLLGRPNSKS